MTERVVVAAEELEADDADDALLAELALDAALADEAAELVELALEAELAEEELLLVAGQRRVTEADDVLFAVAEITVAWFVTGADCVQLSIVAAG